MLEREQTRVGLIFLALPILFVAQATRLTWTAGVVPLSSGILTVLLVAAQLRLDRKERAETAKAAVREGAERAVLLQAAGWACALYLLGFLLVLPIFGGYFRWRRDRSWSGAFANAVTLAVLIGVLLNGLLGLALHTGVLLG